MQQLEQIEMKLAHDEVKRREADERVRQKINAGAQYEEQNKKKFDEHQTAKMKEQEERNKIEEAIREANEKDAKAQADKRLYLKELTAQDRDQKATYKPEVRRGYELGGVDSISKMFDRKTHQAYERRAK